MIMKTVEVEIDTDDVLDDIDTEDLIAELEAREMEAGEKADWTALYNLFALGNREEAVRRVIELIEQKTGRIVP